MTETPNRLSGLITRLQSGFYTVETERGAVVARLRGRLKQGRQAGDIAALGDRVVISLVSGEEAAKAEGATGDEKNAGKGRWPKEETQTRVASQNGTAPLTGVIEEVEPRRNALSRLAPMPKGEYRQILLANIDQMILIFACAHPAPRFGMLDRFLVIAEKEQTPALIVANKVDLIGMEAAEAIFGHYRRLGYPVIYTSAKTGDGIERLHAQLVGKLSGFTGPSGVGKSTLLNAIQPHLGLAVRDVSEATRKGRHTTVVRQLYPLAEGGYVADTPGIKSLALWDTTPEELDAYFPELRERVAHCQFSDCTHRTEPGCAVHQAFERGEIHPERYRSYLRMRYGDEEGNIG